MFSRPTRLIAAVILAVAALAVRTQAEDLLASGSLQSLLGSGDEGGQPAPGEKPGEKSLTKKGLKSFLSAAGFHPKELGNDVYQIEVKSGDWAFPALVELSRDEQIMWLTLSLKTVADEARIPADKMLAMLAANQKHGPSFFEYSSKLKRFHLSRSQPNLGMTPERLVAIAELQAKIALETESLWNSDKWGTVPVARHVGAWTGNADATVYSLTLAADGTFVLTTRTTNKENTSRGRFTLNGNNLSMVVTDTDRMDATLEWENDNTFAFKTSSLAKGVRFTRA